MGLLDANDWIRVYEAAFEAEILPLYPKQHKPLPNLILPLTFDIKTIAVEVYSLTAKPTWRLGVTICPFLVVSNLFDLSFGYYKTGLNQTTLIEIKDVAPDYKVKVLIPKWIFDIRIAIWINKNELAFKSNLQANFNKPNTTIFINVI